MRGYVICEECRNSNKTLCFEICSISYEHYMQYSQYNPPDVVIGF